MNCPVEKLSAFAAPAQASVNDIHEKAAILFNRIVRPLSLPSLSKQPADESRAGVLEPVYCM
jgi:hypothetical protein